MAKKLRDAKKGDRITAMQPDPRETELLADPKKSPDSGDEYDMKVKDLTTGRVYEGSGSGDVPVKPKSQWIY